MSKKALIFGITGQDGSYLSELLLSKNYEVHGVIRRSSSFNTGRIDHIFDKLNLHYGDITDPLTVSTIISQILPDEIYNLSAQSHVKVSFEQPYYTGQVDGIGVLSILESVRKHCPNTKVYQASTSELYGGVVENMPVNGFNEESKLHPRSPYGVAKIYGYWATKNYREAYNMFCCNGILFNHETVADITPLIFKEGDSDEIDIKPISEIVKYHTNKNKISINQEILEYQETNVTNNLYVWDKGDWTKVKYASGYPHDIENNNKNPKFIISKNASYLATSSHECIMEDGSDKKFENIKIGDKVSIINYPTIKPKDNKLSKNELKLIGFIIGDGSISKNKIRITGKNKDILDYYAKIWDQIGGNHKISIHESGFTGKKDIYQYNLYGNKEWTSLYLNDIYTDLKYKRVPKFILNSNNESKKNFLDGYNDADGLKSNKCTYKYKNFKTNSQCLASGLLFLINSTTNQNFNINVEYIDRFGKDRLYYSLNLLSNGDKSYENNLKKYNKVNELLKNGYNQRKINRETGISRSFIRKIKNGYSPITHYLNKPNNEVKKIIDVSYDGWFFDLETESGTFHAGIGKGHIHNSPRRGETFVTRKITIGLTNIFKGKQKEITLGYIDAKRDWGHAKDYVYGMYLMLQQDEPKDYVLSLNETHSVREFIEIACKELGWDIEWIGEGINEVGVIKSIQVPNPNVRVGDIIFRIDKKYFRPSEVDVLLGDSTQARNDLGWKPEYSFEELVKEMIQSDLNN